MYQMQSNEQLLKNEIENAQSKTFKTLLYWNHLKNIQNYEQAEYVIRFYNLI